MLKIPFIETTFVGIQILDSTLHWVEANKLGNRISILSNGSIQIEESLESAISELINELSNDAYYIGVSCADVLKDVHIEEVTISEDESEQWIQNYNQSQASDQSSFNSKVVAEFVDLDEDLKKVIRQVFDSEKVTAIHSIFNSNGLYPVYVTSGLFESGYSQILNPDFIDGFSSTLFQASGHPYLVIYNNGRVFQVHSLTENENSESIVEECDSILKTEELSNELPLDSIPFYSSINLESGFVNRNLATFEFSNYQGNKELNDRYAMALGVVMKLAFSELDHVDLQKEKTLVTAQWVYAKNELIRLSVLLFAPLIFFVLVAYGADKIIETSLFELTQVNDQISGNLTLVETQRERAEELQEKFQNLKSDVVQKIYVTETFEIVASIIPVDVWLTDFSTVINNGRVDIELAGISLNSSSISVFQRRFQDHESTAAVQLLSSELVRENGNPTSQIEFRMRVLF